MLSVFPVKSISFFFSTHPVASTFTTVGDYAAVNFLNEPFRGRPFNTHNRQQCFSVSIVNDDTVESCESFNVTITNAIPSTSVTVEPAEVMITIMDRNCECNLCT